MKKTSLIGVTILMLLTACNGNESTKKTVTKETKKERKMLRPDKSEEIKLEFGMTFEEFRKMYPNVPTRSGNTFYEKRWKTKNPSTIFFKYDETKILELPYTIRLYFSAFEHEREKGLSEFQTQTGITQADLLPYEEARVMFHSFLQRLLKEGWKRALNYYNPRISGRHAMHYKLTEDDMYYQDPEYEPTLEEWKKLETGGMGSSNYWVLHYKNKIFLEINLGVTAHKTDPNLASYLMFITIRDAEEEAMVHLVGDDKLKWKEKFPEMTTIQLNDRQKTETKLKTKGYTMDESYEDYVIDPKQW